MSSLKDKEYPSLKRKGLSIGSGSYKPVNTLGAAPRNELPNSNNVSEETFLSNITMKRVTPLEMIPAFHWNVPKNVDID